MSVYRFCMTFAAIAALVIASPVVRADDECATASLVVDGANAIDTTGYTASAEPNPTGCTNSYGQNLADGWYSWTAGACDTTVTVETCDGASFDTDLAMYDGGCGALNLLACDGDGGDAAGCQGFDSKLTDIPVTAGTTYLIRVGGWGAGEEGPGTLTITPVACPTPDECAGAAIVVDGANAIDTTGYTASAEPNPTGCTNSYGQNLADGWYSWTAGACDTTVTVETCDGASFDTDLAMYDGGCGALNLLACDGDGGDAAGCQGFDSKLTDIPVTAGTTYLIRVGGWGAGEEGPGTLTITPVACPTPDECAGAAIVVDGANAIDTTGYTASAEPNPTGCTNSYGQNLADGWYSWTAGACDTTVTVETCDGASFDTDLAMYSGDCSALNLLACDGDGGDAAGCQGFDSKLTDIPVTAGETYLIRCGGWGAGEEGPGTLTITPVACPPASQDECVDAGAVFDGANAIDTTGYTASAEPNPTGCTNSYGQNLADGWYSWTAGACTTVTVETCDGASFDTDLAMYSGDCSALNLLACDGDGGDAAGCQGFDSKLTDVPVTPGETYLIRCGGWGAGEEGPGTLTITPGGCPPPDECVNAVPMVEGPNAYDTTGYTASAEPNPTGCTNSYGQNLADGWFSFTPSGDGILDLDTCDPAGFDTDLALYSGDCSALVLVACDGDGGTAAGCQGFDSAISGIVVNGGETYLIRCGGWGAGEEGPGTLNIALALLAPEDCSTPGDEDGDGAADCADSDCVAFPACIEAGNCADLIDNDGDGLTDCDDDECFTDPACAGCPTGLSQTLNDGGGSGVWCPSLENYWARIYETDGLDCPDGVRVTSVSFAVSTAVAADPAVGTSVTIEIYADSNGGTPSFSEMTLMGSETIQVMDDQVDTYVTHTLATPVAMYAGQAIVVALHYAGGPAAGGDFMPQGATGGASGQIADAYLASVPCGLPDFLATAAIGFPDASFVIDLGIDDLGAGPAGDECASALAVTEGANAYDSTDFTDSAEPAPTGCSNSFGANANDIWFSYTASYAGDVTMDTCDPLGFDTDISAYSGSCGSLTLLACDGDSGSADGCQNFDSEISLGVVATGDTFIVRIGGWGVSDMGPGTLNITNVPPPPTINEIRIDNPGGDVDEYFELAGLPQSLDGLSYIVIGDGTGGSGTIESVTDLTGQSMGGGGFWWAGEASTTLGTPDMTATLNFENSDNVTHMLVSAFTGVSGDDLDTDDDGVLDVTPWDAVIDSVAMLENEIDPATGNTSGGELVYSSTTVGPDGTFVPGHAERCPDGFGDWAVADFDPAAGTDSPGASNTCLAPPANDECDTAFEAFLGSNEIYNISATDSADPWDAAACTGGDMAADVWHHWTSPGDGTLTVSTCDTGGFDTDSSINTGACGALTQIACSGDAGDGTGNGGACQPWYSEYSVAVTAGTTYYLRNGGWGAADQGINNMELTFSPAGDEPCDAIVIAEGTTLVDNTTGSDSAVPIDDTSCPGAFLGGFANDMWYSYTPTIDCTVQIDTCDIDGFDTDLAVYEGDCAALDGTTVACSGDGEGLVDCQGFYSNLEFAATANTTYLIRVGGWNAASTGQTEMHVTCIPNAVDPTASFVLSGYSEFSINFRPVTLTDSSDNGGDDTAMITVDWGDGTPTETAAPGSSLPHVYQIALEPGATGFHATPSVSITNIVNSDTATGDQLTILLIGDANNDLNSDAADSITVLTYLYGGGSYNCYQVADLNGDETVNLGDVVYGLYFLFLGGDIPVLPANPNCDL